MITGLGPGPDLRVKVPYVIVRRHGTAAEFVAVLEPGSGSAKVVGVSEKDGKIVVRSAKWEDTIETGTKVGYKRVALP